jgi:DNA (cytosine-5)-methyltransferase 1
MSARNAVTNGAVAMPAAPQKPKYQIPSMSDIEQLPWNGLNAISTFSGCGGSSLGYKMAGFRVLWASEFVPAAQETYRANHKDTILDTRDIRKVQPQDILEAIGMQSGEIDLLDGSPPCASFSTSGKRETGWGRIKDYSDTRQRTDDLFFEFARLVQGIQPKVFVAENVSGLVKGVAKGYFLEILSSLKNCGYKVSAKLLDAQWLGVPQMRQRLIFVGVRNDLGVEPQHPKPLPYRYSLRDAIPWIVSEKRSGKLNNWQPSDQPANCIVASGADRSESAYFSGGTYIEAETDISRYAIGEEWEKLQQGEESDRYFNLKRSNVDTPSQAILASHGNPSTAGVTHPTEKRKFSIAELKRICSFPDDFVLTGTYEQQWERLGRAVPPIMMRAIAQTIVDKVLKCLKR